jgi:hypothetical protein
LLAQLLETGKGDLAVIKYSVNKKGIQRDRVLTLRELRRLIDDQARKAGL